jgi:hypothetical protein
MCGRDRSVATEAATAHKLTQVNTAGPLAGKLNFCLSRIHCVSHFHAVVWLDHHQAHVMHITPEDVEKSVIHPDKPHAHLHSKRGAVGSGKQPEDQAYYHAIVEALQGAQEILVVGPAQAKLQLIKHIHSHDHGMSDKIVGVETVNHPSDAQLVAHARSYFVAKDRMLAQP